MFGTIPTLLKPMGVQATPPAMAQIAPTVNYGVALKRFNYESNKQLSDYESSIKNTFDTMFAKPEITLQLERAQLGCVVRKGERLCLRRATPTRVMARRAELQRLAEFEEDFRNGFFDSTHGLGHVQLRSLVARGEQVSFRSPFYQRSARRAKKVAKQRIIRCNPANIIHQILEIASHNSIAVEFIGKRHKPPTEVKYKRIKNSVIPFFTLPHNKGRIVRQEMSRVKHNKLIEMVAKYRRLRDNFGKSDITFGWSGSVLPEVITGRGRTRENVVVRGRLDGRIIDARSKMGFHSMLRMTHYSDGEVEFFKGWKEAFVALESRQRMHECKIDHDNHNCGRLAATIVQTLYPCHKLSCEACRVRISELTTEEYNELINIGFQINAIQIESAATAFSGIEKPFDTFKGKSIMNPNLPDGMEIQRITQGKKQTHMQLLHKLNEVLIKGNAARPDDFAKATKYVLELTQWFAKHQNLTAAGSLDTFRNKISQKALLNPSLMCDNQLDQNGNFVWGKRGYHAKRFFENFFQVVEVGDGYRKYIERESPNCKRKLAIGNLIIPINFERARMALTGETIERVPISEACVSRLDGHFLHACCCVTSDIGTPIYSDIKHPTKRHLVIGNTGDPKLIDLPASEDEKMYVTKNGYCYLNIFLAMLVNVNESEAKAFTKMVRDVIIPELGQWPSMQDVATACYIMTVFHPETRNAELPRILVDHAAQTMHVIDSFGSLTTGYHILKTGTVAQLINFASQDLMSEMKHYKIGGTEFDELNAEINAGGPGTKIEIRRERLELQLIKSIFRPKKLIYIIQQDPYVLLMSLVSPSLIINLFNSGALELAMKEWVKKDQPLSLIFSMLSSLAQKLSRADLLVEQYNMIGTMCKQIQEVLYEHDCSEGTSFEVRMLLDVIVEKASTDIDLQSAGFFNFNLRLHDLTEKIYRERLDKEWHDLSWFGKYSYITFSRKSKPKLAECVPMSKKEGIDDKYAVSCTWLLGKIKGRLATAHTYTSRKISDTTRWVQKFTVNRAIYIVTRCYKDVLYFANVLVVVAMLATFIKEIHGIVLAHRMLKLQNEIHKRICEDKALREVYDLLSKSQGEVPTKEEFRDALARLNPEMIASFDKLEGDTDIVEFQAKTKTEHNLEKVMAFMALITMMYDTEKSDAVFRVLGKVKTIFGTLGEEVRYQSLDDVQSLEPEKKLTIDFEMESGKDFESTTMDVRFKDWWHKQLEQNRVVPHYRMGGHFIEFTRTTTATVCLTVKNATEQEFLIRGAVGSGKSTGLPHGLSKHGKVLLLEPTRPLAENVCKQLRKEPFNISPTLRMRGNTSFGSDNVTIMTCGFALHYYANNPDRLREVDFVMLDECHVLDSSTMAFYCLLKECSFVGKILKVSATPPGKECEFKTQHEVIIKVEDSLSFVQFSQAQGTRSNADVTQYGDNILVYVASYNDVDALSKLLLEAKHTVTKVDGRTMKLGSVEIPTRGTPGKKHFIVATNIIENGVTLDIEVVVDFGMKVLADLDVDCKCMRYVKTPVNYGERLQRMGRVGRVKPGAALRIGHTEIGLVDIPKAIATEAAFLCFAYGLPVITHNVTTSVLGNCTVKQARTMLQFELPPYYMIELVGHNGVMHPMIHSALKHFKLRDSEIELNKLAIPNSGVSRWLSAHEYKKTGVQLECEDDIKLPFASRNIPDKVHTQIWEIVKVHRSDAGFGRLTSACASSVAYTLNTEPTALPKTIAIIDHLIREEQQKKAHFEALSDTLCMQKFSLAGIVDGIRKRYLKDNSSYNIHTLQRAKAQLLDFASKEHNYDNIETLMEYGIVDTVQYQNCDQIAKRLELKDRWNKSLAMTDLFVSGVVLVGGCWMAWEYLKTERDSVAYQAKGREKQKLRFRDARDRKVGREVYGDDGTVEHYFGEAYTKRGAKKGNHTTKGMGIKSRPFIHMYGFDPADYSFVRFVDPITGHAVEESPMVDMRIVQEDFEEAREKALEKDDDLYEYIRNKPGIQAYFMKVGAREALKVDLSPHRPLAMGRNSNSIAGYPEHENILRQTGPSEKVDIASVPLLPDIVVEEAKSIARGIRNYNPIATSICQLRNESDGHVTTIHGIGYGPVIITNGHLFNRNNGTLLIRSHHGEFRIPNTTQIAIHHVPTKDMIIIKMPKDFPPFPMKLQFRAPRSEERACLIGSLFQQKSVTSCVSESTIISKITGSSFWKHWVSTRDGDCGLPLVATKDGQIIGFHGLTSTISNNNYLVPFHDTFRIDILEKLDCLNWTKQWKHSPDKIAWNGLHLKSDAPDPLFRMSKVISDLNGWGNDEVREQSVSTDKWVLSALEGNLKAVATSTSQLVTKHTVKGPCAMFQLYCAQHTDAKRFFEPLMGAYRPSRLNKEAYKKDFFKYNGAITVGLVDTEIFERAVESVITLLKKLGFGECNYVTDSFEIFNSLNRKAAVGAMYTGKKEQYLEGMSADDKSLMLQKSCERLYTGKMGIWNGSLKAELRPIEKTNENKTRTFTAAPIDTLLGGKVCVDDFNNRFYALNLEGPWSVGMTKFYGGWDKLLNKLPEDWIYCDADGSQFDSSLTPYLINAVVTLREAFMERWDIGEKMLRNFYTEIVYTPILTPDGTIVKKFKGNNSGQPSTVVDNTLMVVITMHYSLLKLGWTEEAISQKIVFYANGDDLIIAIRKDEEQTLDKLSELFFELGLKYDFSSRHTNRTDLWFMSHQGMQIDGGYIPKLEQERIVSILEWDRSTEISHRAEAICASMIEAWGYPDLLTEIRKFYLWLMNRPEYMGMCSQGKMPYIADTALRRLYTGCENDERELMKYWYAMIGHEDESGYDSVAYQANDEKKKPEEKTIDAGDDKGKAANKTNDILVVNKKKDKEVDVGSSGAIPRLRALSKMRMPMVKGNNILNIEHLITYKPDQTDLSNTRATHQQLSTWFDAIKEEYEVTDAQMKLLLNGFMVWCIENGTSPSVNGTWVMMDGDEQVEYPLKPIIENAKPTLRQIMHHFSDAAETYIEMRNAERPYMPRYGIQRNLRDKSLARYAFDFYEVTSRTNDRAREAVMQMKAAALANTSTKLFGLDGNVATASENTERHIATDVNQNMHSLMGVVQK